MILKIQNKSLSPIISTILLVVVSVILVLMVLIWGKGFTNSKLSPSTTSFLKSEISSFLFVRSVHQLETENILFIKNAHEKEAINFIGYKLHTDTGYVFENQLLYFDEVKELSPGEIKPFSVVCFPKKSFTIELITDKNTFVNLSIKVPNFNEEGYCLGISDSVLFYDMKTIVGDQLIDISGNANNGTLLGSWELQEKGLFFEISGSINIGSPEVLNFQPTDSFTLGVVYSVYDILKTENNGQIYSSTTTILGRGNQLNSVGIGSQAIWEPSTNQMKNFVVLTGSRAKKEIAFSSNILKEKKYVVFYVYTPGIEYTYINGVLKNSKENLEYIDGMFKGLWGIFARGAVPGGNAKESSGFVSYAVIYDRALTPEEIKKYYYASISFLE